jgi:hypothetical protein
MVFVLVQEEEEEEDDDKAYVSVPQDTNTYLCNV